MFFFQFPHSRNMRPELAEGAERANALRHPGMQPANLMPCQNLGGLSERKAETAAFSALMQFGSLRNCPGLS